MGELDVLDLSDDLALSDDDDDDDDAGEETITAREVLERLESAWINEKFSPELLPHQGEIVDCIVEQINGMESNLDLLRPGDLRGDIHRLELERIRFVLAAYLRTRLEKIEEFTAHILEQERGRAEDDRYLSPQERKFAEEFQENSEAHFKGLALRHMPHNLQEFDRRKMRVAPNLNSHVFLKAVESTYGVMLGADGDDVVDLTENSQHIMSYSAITALVKTGAVQLI